MENMFKGNPFFFLFSCAVFSAALFFTPASCAYALGTFLTNEYMQILPTEFNAALMHDGKQETIIANTVFQFNPFLAWNFTWLIVVPGKPTVEEVGGSDIFWYLKELSKNSPAGASSTEKNDNLSRGAGYFDKRVFAPEEGSAPLFAWANEHGYFIPKALKPKIKEYQKDGWYFIALDLLGTHIQQKATDSLLIDTAYTIPIKITFPSDRLVYPLALATYEQDYDSLAVPAAFRYGTPSERILGEKNSAVDILLSEQSPNKFPRVPYGNTRAEVNLFVFHRGELHFEEEGWEKVATSWLDGDAFARGAWNSFYFDLLGLNVELSRYRAYRKLGELEDFGITEERTAASQAALALFSLDEISKTLTTLFFLAAAAIGLWYERAAITTLYIVARAAIKRR